MTGNDREFTRTTEKLVAKPYESVKAAAKQSETEKFLPKQKEMAKPYANAIETTCEKIEASSSTSKGFVTESWQTC
jgi:hypothetical protein